MRQNVSALTIGPCGDHRHGGGNSPSDVIGQNGAQPRNPLAMVVRSDLSVAKTRQRNLETLLETFLETLLKTLLETPLETLLETLLETSLINHTDKFT
jgi:hypothetical protein